MIQLCWANGQAGTELTLAASVWYPRIQWVFFCPLLYMLYLFPNSKTCIFMEVTDTILIFGKILQSFSLKKRVYEGCCMQVVRLKKRNIEGGNIFKILWFWIPILIIITKLYLKRFREIPILESFEIFLSSSLQAFLLLLKYPAVEYTEIYRHHQLYNFLFKCEDHRKYSF